MSNSASYAAAGVDTAAGDKAVELMKAAIAKTHSPNVIGGVGGFAGMWDLSEAKNFTRPVLATSTDGVGTKVAIATAIDKHNTIGQDLVGMVVDDIIVVGAKPLFMTDYIACGKVVPERIADIVRGIAEACSATGTALVGGETAEHPGLMEPNEYDLAGAAVGLVEADRMLGPDRVQDGDAVIAIASSGPHANGYSLIRHILATAKVDFRSHSDELGTTWGEALLEPTRLYSGELATLLAGPSGGAVHALSHVTGGGIAANLARVLPRGSWAEVDRSTWSPQDVFKVLCQLSGASLESTEGTWNLGIGMIAVVDAGSVAEVVNALAASGHHAWQVGVVSMSAMPDATRAGDAGTHAFEQGAKGVDGGAVRLVGTYSN